MRSPSVHSDTLVPATSSSRTTSGHIPPRWAPVIRSAWLVSALLLLANMVASLPVYYQIMNAVCALPTQSDCVSEFGQLTATTVQSLNALHISLNAYAVYFVALNMLVSLLPWGIGLLLFWRRSADWMGLFVSLLLILVGGNGVSNTLSGLWMPNPPTPFFTLLLTVSSGMQWIGFGVFLLTFPTGRFAPRWSWIILVFWIGSFLQPSIQVALPDDSTAMILQGIVSLLETVVIFGGALFVLVYRYLRVFDATQRQQTKWVVYAAAIWFVVNLMGMVLSNALPADSPYQILAPTVTLVLPATILYLGLGFAILRYRLWDIDTIINRTLVYGILSAILSLTYVGIILLAHALTSALTAQQLGDPPLVIVGSTLLIVALFNPLRHRIQTLIDRRFYRRKYDAAKILAAFTASLRTEIDLTDLSEHLVHVVDETMQPTHLSLWLRPRTSEQPPAKQRQRM